MEVLKITAFAFILTVCYRSTRAMGLCDFEEKFPCEEDERSVCFKNTGCGRKRPIKTRLTSPTTNKQPVSKQSDGDIFSSKEVFVSDQMTTSHAANDQVTNGNPTIDQISNSQATTDQITTRHSPTNQTITAHSSTLQLATDHVAIDQATLGYSTTDQITTSQAIADKFTSWHTAANQVVTSNSPIDPVTTAHSTPNQVDTTSPLCPPNMVYANCTTCQGTCMDPKSCITNCTESQTCVCDKEFLLNGDKCVLEEECGCIVEGEGVVPEGHSHIFHNCSQRCFCTGGQFTCYNDFQCSINAVCDTRNDVIQCYCNKGYTGDGVNCIEIKDCQDVYDRVSKENGVYQIKPTSWQGIPFDVYCNMSDGGGWTVFQRRMDGSQDFSLKWKDYKAGFGTPDRELWLGNEKLHSLTTQKSYEVRVDVIDSRGDPYYAKHSTFSISDESNDYRLSVGRYLKGNAGNKLSHNNGQPFTTRDRDNDRLRDRNCAINNVQLQCGRCNNNAAWWYNVNPCSYLHLNGPYGNICFRWDHLSAGDCNIKYTEMKVRPI